MYKLFPCIYDISAWCNATVNLFPILTKSEIIKASFLNCLFVTRLTATFRKGR